MAAAILSHIRLYWLTPSGLADLTHDRMRSWPRHPVLPQHRCGIRWPYQAAPQPDPQTDDTPPY